MAKKEKKETWETPFLLSMLSFTTDSSSPTLLLSQVIFNSFSEATGGAGGQGQDIEFSLCWSFFLTQFPHTNMGPPWVVVQPGKRLLQCGLMYGSFVGWSFFYHEEHPFHPLNLMFLLIFLTLSFFFPSSSACMVCSALSWRHLRRGAFSFADMLSGVLQSIAEPARTVCVWHEAAPGLFPQRPLLQPLIAETLPHEPNST